MLFSEPKIPQSKSRLESSSCPVRFSALQRAENSSILCETCGEVYERLGFSALQRAENSSILSDVIEYARDIRFSALQRAENSSIRDAHSDCTCPHRRFSALQRAENSSMKNEELYAVYQLYVSVLFSEPKIPQCKNTRNRKLRFQVSVLFSEPKIPQWVRFVIVGSYHVGFSALQRAENSSIETPPSTATRSFRFQCSSASRKFLN